MRERRMRRTTTMRTQSKGTATRSPSGPSNRPTMSTKKMVSTGGRSTFRDMMYGETKLPSTRWTNIPSPMTQGPGATVRRREHEERRQQRRKERPEKRNDGGESREHAERQREGHLQHREPRAAEWAE